ncbi:MAG: caspase family protein [Chitinophagaceae bacterium]|nr:MAG: caspase family protein [Chitinophagaceae bacterium]
MEFAITIVPAGKAVTAVHVIDNGVPVYGKSGWRITRTTSATQMAIKVPLEKGRNKLQVFVSDEGGMVSASENVTVVADYLASEPVTYFVGIGIDKFTDSRHNLNYSVKDIRDLAFRLQARGAIVNIDTLFNENVTVENVAALKRRLVSAKTNDKIVVAYSGHGLLSKNFDYFLSTYNVDFQNPEIGGLSYEAFESLLDSIPVRKKLVLIDACHSGEVDKEEMLQYKTVVQTKAADGLKGLDIENTDSSKVGMKNSFELMQELFMNVGRNTGATIISAAAGTQLAQERGELKNGVFTFSILEYLNEHPVPSVSRLKEYVMKRVPELTAGLQQPTTRNESGQADWTLW